MISSTNRRGKGVKLDYKNTNKLIKPREKKRDQSKYNFKLPLIVLSLVFVYLAVSLGGEMQKLNDMKKSVIEIEQEMEQLQTQNNELRKMLKSLQSNEYVEQIAREKLGLVKPGETLVIPAEKTEADSPQ